MGPDRTIEQRKRNKLLLGCKGTAKSKAKEKLAEQRRRTMELLGRARQNEILFGLEETIGEGIAGYRAGKVLALRLPKGPILTHKCTIKV